MSRKNPKLEYIGKYAIDRKKSLGGGQFGQVYLGTDDKGENIAAKEIKLHDYDDDDPDPVWIGRVHGEIEAHKRIPDHVNLVKYIDSIQDENVMWVFTEPCQAGDLSKYVRKNTMSEKQKFLIMRELAEAIKHLHTQNPAIAHRDVKAENILMGDDGHVKLCDLGLAKITEKKGDRTETLLTHCGSKPYMAPELFRLDEDQRAKYTKKVDIFSMGIFYVTFIEASPGQRLQVFTVNGRPIGMQMYDSQKLGGLTSAPIKFNLQDSAQVKRLKALASTMIQMDPDDRPAIEQVISELDEIIATMPDEQPSAPSVASAPRRTTSATSDLAEALSELSTSDVRPKAATVVQASAKTVVQRTEIAAPGPAAAASNSRLAIIGGLKNLDEAETSYACWSENESDWKHFTDIPVGITYGAVSAIQGGLFMAGGADPHKCYVYKLQTNRWQQRQDMPTGRCVAAAVTVGESVIVMGGKRDDDVLNACEKFDVQKNNWSKMNAMLQGMLLPSAALIQSNIYVVFNNYNANKTNQNGNETSMQILDTITEEWTFGPPLPDHFGSTSGASAVTVNDTMLVAGGAGRMLAQYVPSTRVWVKLTPPHLHHLFGAAVFSEGRVILAGGKCQGESGEFVSSDAMEEYNIITDKWVIRKDKMPIALYCHHMILLDM